MGRAIQVSPTRIPTDLEAPPRRLGSGVGRRFFRLFTMGKLKDTHERATTIYLAN